MIFFSKGVRKLLFEHKQLGFFWISTSKFLGKKLGQVIGVSSNTETVLPSTENTKEHNQNS